MRKIKLMADYQCFPIWDMTPDAYGDVDPMTLPISETLAKQIMLWAKTYDETLNLEDPYSSGFLTPSERDAFQAEGLRLAERLRDELGPNFDLSVNVSAFVKNG